MKRYMLFNWDQHYPTGGMNDFRGSFDELDSAVRNGEAMVKGDGLKRYQVYDTEEMRVVAYEHGAYE